MSQGATELTPVDRVAKLRADGRRRPRLIIVGLAVTLVAVFLVRVLLGTYTVTFPDFITILQGGSIEGARGARYIVLSDKLPRAVLGTLTGLAFGCAGAIFQLLLRNPLASPDIIGISSGASLGAVLGIVFWGSTGFEISFLAVAFSLALAILIMVLAAGHGGVGNRFILMGIGVAALGNAVVNYLLTRIDINSAQSAMVWMTGSLSVANWERILILLIALCLIFPAVMLFQRQLHAIAVGEELAQSLGLNVTITRWLYIVLGVLLAAVATAASGPIAFVAFVSGPIARRLIGGRHSLTASALVGAIIVVFADFIAANFIPGGAMPVGVLTGAFGAPILIWLLVQSQKEGRS
ncbi:iron ABC transporter permease [uncultured Rothia sp.]|uniref:iron chelate uptake ABC transporter family permease subunit n=1 Tax=uncultured Rothia sp. TaxID=316088 RepID=UPI0011A67031